jgi:uncharacterized membrane protein
MGFIQRGLVAGAFGTVLLNAATYVDMALTGRPASNTPGRTVEQAANAVGLDPPTDEPRLEAYGALGGMATGLGLGVLASMGRSAGIRLPAPLGAVAIGGLAMAASDGGMTAAGITDPRTWTSADWARDVIPHLAYGVGARWAMDRVDSSDGDQADRPTSPSRLGLLARAAAIGLASGGRSSLSLGGQLAATGATGPALAAVGLVGTELVVDKVPGVPSRLAPGPLAGRIVSGAAGATVLARRRGAPTTSATLAGLVGAVGAFLGSVAGATWRDLAAERGRGWSAALAEDGVALALTIAACR